MRRPASTPLLLALVGAGALGTACGDPCDGEEAWLGDFFVKEPADLDDLEGVRCVTGSLLIGDIEHDPERAGEGLQGLELSLSLTNLDGLEDLEVVEGDLHIAGNGFLTNLDGLRNLTEVGREVRFEKYPRGDLILHQNSTLRDLDGLESLYLTGANLIVSANDFLEDIDGMRALEKVGWELRVVDNPNLDTEDVQDFGRDVSAVGGLIVSGNGGAGGGS